MNKIPTVEIDTDRAVSNYVNQYVFQHYWNDTKMDLRQNIRLSLCGVGPVSASVRIGSLTINLPSRERCLVYAFNGALLNPVSWVIDRWTKLDSFINDSDEDYRVHDARGHWIHRGLVYALRSGQVCLLCIPLSYYHACVPAEEQTYKLFLGVYHHAQKKESVSVSTYKPVTKAACAKTAAACKAAEKDGQVCFKNGLVTHADLDDEIKVGDVVEVVTDKTVEGDFWVDLSSRKGTFVSDQTQGLYRLVHVPKELNPSGDLLTHDTCDFYLDTGKRGVFMPRTDTADKIIQLTHQDFAIQEDYIRSIGVELGGDAVYDLHIYIRSHKHRKALLRNSCYLNYLYMLDDDQIVDQLLARAKDQMDFWKAEYLEDSELPKALFMPAPAAYKDLKQTVNVLGFYNTLNVVCGRVQDLTAPIKWIEKDWEGNPVHKGNHVWNVAIPYTFLDKKNLTIHVFVNGQIVNPGQFHFKRVNQYLHVELDKNIDIHFEDRVHVELFDSTPFTGEYYTAAIGSHYLNIGSTKDYRLFICSEADRELEYPNPKYDQVKDIFGYLTEIDTDAVQIGYLKSQLYDHTTDGAFLESGKVIPGIGCYVIDDETEDLYQVSAIDSISYEIHLVKCEDDFDHYIQVTVDGENRLYFKNGADQKKYLAVTKTGYGVVFNETFNLEDFWHGPIETGPLSLKVPTWNGDTVEIPLLDPDRFLVYLNGLELVPMIDYQIVKDYSEDGRLAGLNLIIQNSGYLNDINNLLVFTVNEKVVSSVQGFYVGDKIEVPIGTMTDFQCLSTVVTDGLVSPYERITGREGAVYRVRTLVPEDLEAYYESFSKAKETDVNRILQVADLIDVTDTSRGLSIIEHSHSIYSTTMTTIIRDVLLGQIALMDSVDDEAVLSQVEAYLPLLKRDLAFTQPFDLRYLDVEMSYREHLVEDVTVKRILDRIFLLLYNKTDEVRSYRIG